MVAKEAAAATAAAIAARSPASPLDLKTRGCIPETESLTRGDGTSADSTGDFRVRSSSDAMQPPFCEGALVTDDGVTTPDDFLLPSYPRHRCFGPYSLQGIVFWSA